MCDPLLGDIEGQMVEGWVCPLAKNPTRDVLHENYRTVSLSARALLRANGERHDGEDENADTLSCPFYLLFQYSVC